MIDASRVKPLSYVPSPRAGDYVLYWMQASHRTRFNQALDYAAERANELNLPLVVCFGLMDDYPEANLRHYVFMLQGLRDVQAALKKRGILFVIRRGQPWQVAAELAGRAALAVTDCGYLRHQKLWRASFAKQAKCSVIQIESDVVVPVAVASSKQEFAARTFRPKIHKVWQPYLKAHKAVPIKRSSFSLDIASDINLSDPVAAAETLKVDRSVPASPRFVGGEVEAQRRLKTFCTHALKNYAEGRSEPAGNGCSYLSPYLHFGHISPVDIALAAQNADAPAADRDAFIEELIVRRELAVNFVNYCEHYDTYAGLPAWARATLKKHANDEHEWVYSLTQLESARTHDEFWNAAQREMTSTGYMHNNMRMYWGKKILEWSPTPEDAYVRILTLNNRYFLDGRDPNAYTNVAWIFGLHDRPWGPERSIFGLVRYMNAAGLARKFDMRRYVEMW